MFWVAQLSSERVVKAFIERCRQVDGRLNAVVEERFAAALEEARRVDASLEAGKMSVEELRLRTPLLGVPVTVKEACKVDGKARDCGKARRRPTVRASRLPYLRQPRPQPRRAKLETPNRSPLRFLIARSFGAAC